MYKRFVSALYVLNIVFQAFYTLALPIGIGALASFLLTKYASAPRWIWAVLLLFGVFTGLYSMIKFILTAAAGLDRLEKQQAERAEEAKKKARPENRQNDRGAEMKKKNEKLGEKNGTE